MPRIVPQSQYVFFFFSFVLVIPLGSWDVIADAAKWARAREEILIDAHWVCGDCA